METLKSLSLHESGINFELSVQLSGGAASVALGTGMSDLEVIQQLHGLAHLLEEGTRDRANASYQLKFSIV